MNLLHCTHEGTHPGGCVIGPRPIDLHLAAFQEWGVAFEEIDGEECKTIRGEMPFLPGTVLSLSYPSVGATENLMMAGTLCQGELRIRNAAREPEIVDLQNYLNACGAMVRGAGSAEIVVRGVRELYRDVRHSVMPDRIEAGTYLLAAGIMGKTVRVSGCRPQDLCSLTSVLMRCGCEIDVGTDGICVEKGLCDKWLRSPGTVIARPHPGFPTDLQAPLTTLLTRIEGVAVVQDEVFEDRFQHVAQLRKMGAHISQDRNRVRIRGVDGIHGELVQSSDLRCGAALILAGLMAEGHTRVRDAHFVERGYANIVNKLQTLGADIQCIQ